MKTVVQFGAGNIGRGFMGDIFTAAGYRVVFVDVAPEVVAALNERRSYPLRLVGPDRFEERVIRPVHAVDGRNVDLVAQQIADSEFVSTAVGVQALPHIAPALAAGIRSRMHGRRTAPPIGLGIAIPPGLPAEVDKMVREQRPNPRLNVILCENQLHCSDLLRGYLLKHLKKPELAQVGLVESVVSRMVPVVPEELKREDPLLVLAEDYPTLPVDRSAFVGEIPAVPGFRPVDDFGAFVERKLFLHNMGHAVAAYLGYERGCEYVHEAMALPEVDAVVTGAMEESELALSRKHGFDAGELRRHSQDLRRRFRNRHMRDTILRVSRDPVRKLRPDDRLTGAALNCLDWEVVPRNIARGLAAAFRFDPPDDPGALQVRKAVAEEGFARALERFTGRRTDSELGVLALAAWAEELRAEG